MRAKLKLMSAMLTFGTVGIFVRHIPLPSSVIALVRGAVGTLFLLLVVTISGKRISREAVRRNFWVLAVSGVAIGINWILLFEAYRYTTVAVATLCYYLAPVFVILLSPIVLKEKLTKKKLFCVIGALSGMVLISGVLNGGIGGGTALKGILFGVGAGAFYACVILMNQFLKEISSFDSTIIQLSAAAGSLLPYVLLTESVSTLTLTGTAALFLLAVAVVHTGIGYCLYFSSLAELDGQTAAIYSYIDPVVAVLLSAFLLHESMDAWSVAGAVLILGSTLASEIKLRRNPRCFSNGFFGQEDEPS